MIFTEQTENNEIIFNETKSNEEYHDRFNTGNDREGKLSNKEKKEYHKEIRRNTEAIKDYNIRKKYGYIEGFNNGEFLNFSGNTGGSYIHDALYESYIQAKIDAEDRLAFALKENMIISEADYSNIRAIQEASLGDKIKAKWNRFVAFIKGIFSRFLESMSNILLDEKDYLEKYKDIILNKKAKEDIEYSYTGDYEEGLKRIMNTHIPIFSYTNYNNEFKAEDDGPLANKLVSGFNYVDGDELASQYKKYFLDLDSGQKTGKLSELNMNTLYKFCYDYPNIKNLINKNIANIDNSTKAIETEINNQLNKVETESAINYFNEEETAETKKDTPEQKTTTNLTVQPSKAMQNVERDENYKAKEKENAATDTETAKQNQAKTTDIEKAADRWIRVTRAIATAQATACQQIAKDYMEIIRAHVRSYGVTDKKDKKNNTNPKDAQKYKKSDALIQAEKENKEAGERLKNATK